MLSEGQALRVSAAKRQIFQGLKQDTRLDTHQLARPNPLIRLQDYRFVSEPTKDEQLLKGQFSCG